MTGTRVVGTYKPVPRTGWSVVSEIPEEAAFGAVRRYRNLALLVVAALLTIAVLTAYRFGALIARPLDRLTKGAAEVAAGDLKVDLPEAGGGEVGLLTGVFNDMVDRLREGRAELDTINETLRAKNEELEKLSITDGLTGLANHRFLMQRLNEEAIRSARTERPFGVLMADVDHFKQYNDSFGHPAGDEVLKLVAGLLRECTRTVDCVGRYGGEEFAVIMPETDNAGALVVAERIRTRIAEQEFPNRGMTLSIGIAEFPTDADSPQSTIAVADQALYQAKRDGRDRVAQARELPKPKTEPATKPRRPSGKSARKKS
jgi:diguanylate cyclase (GGDEF)-like protein